MYPVEFGVCEQLDGKQSGVSKLCTFPKETIFKYKSLLSIIDIKHFGYTELLFAFKKVH